MTIRTQLRPLKAGRFEIMFTAPDFHHGVQFHFRETAYRAEDNFFDLYPDEPRAIEITTIAPLQKLRRALEVRSLIDTA